MSDIENPRDPADLALDDTDLDPEEVVGVDDLEVEAALDTERRVPLDADDPDDPDAAVGAPADG